MAKGFTVLELLIAIVFIGILGALATTAATGGCGNVSGKNSEEALKNARAWADEMGYKNVFVSCVHNDSDGDGYVSCNIREEGKEPIQIECAGAFTFNSGCKQPKMNAAIKQVQ